MSTADAGRQQVGAGAGVQAYGREIVAALHSAAQAMRLYPLENVAVQNALDDLHSAAGAVLDREEVIDLRVAGDFVFLNDSRLRFDFSNYAVVAFLGRTLARHALGGLEVERQVDRNEWAPLLGLLLRDPTDAEPFESFVDRLRAAGVTGIHGVRRPPRGLEPPDERSREVAKRTYFQCVHVAREVLSDVRLGKAVKVRRAKRVVQAVVDQVIADESTMLGMTTLREYDEYTFTHSVNVCILSVVVGQKLALSRMQLYELGLGALFHDIGKMRIDHALTGKTSGLTDEEWHQMQQHPVEGLLALFHMQGFAEVPFRTMLMAYEHHMKIDLKGYPRNRRPRAPTLFSRIVGVADGFDAATSRRSYQSSPWTPDQVLREMRDNPKRGYDGLLVKVLINAMGIYPAGTVVILDGGELAVVASRNPRADRPHQPIVKVVVDERGMALPEPLTLDLSVIDEASGAPRRSIVKTTEAERYGIRVSDYFI